MAGRPGLDRKTLRQQVQGLARGRRVGHAFGTGALDVVLDGADIVAQLGERGIGLEQGAESVQFAQGGFASCDPRRDARQDAAFGGCHLRARVERLRATAARRMRVATEAELAAKGPGTGVEPPVDQASPGADQSRCVQGQQRPGQVLG